MALYEMIFLVRQDASAQQVESLVEDYKGVVEENGGSVAKVESWGVRPVAYRIRKNRKAHFTLLNLDCPHAAIAEIERRIRINEDIIRFMTIRVEEHEEGLSIQMQKRDRDDKRRRDRDDRGDRGDRGDRRPPRDDANNNSSSESAA